MTAWTPVWRIKSNGNEVTSVTLANLTITTGRTDINSITPAGYCNIQLLNTEATNYDFAVNTGITIEVKDTAGTYVPIFGGRISDLSQTVTRSGSKAIVTVINIIATGPLIRLQRAVFNGNLSEATDGVQIAELITDLLTNNWNELPTAETWNSYLPATQTWANAENLGLGEIDAGGYVMRSRQIVDEVIGKVANSIASSALGYFYENSNGQICYADASHRQNYLLANGYLDLDANQALGAGIGIVQRQGELSNKLVIDYGVNFTSQYIAENLESQNLYGLFAEQFNSYVKNTTDIQDMADRLIELRAFPRYLFQSITFPLQSPEMDNADRDALINVFMGQPVRISNLPPQMLGGQFTGFIEGWTFRASVSGLSITFNATPTEFSATSQRWNQVNIAESWNSILNTLEWQDAIGVIS